MDKLINFPGINPDVRMDQLSIDGDTTRPAMFGLLQYLAVGTNKNFIISGCQVVTGGVSPNNSWALSAGYIYLNDEIVQVNSNSGTFDALTQVLAFSKTTTYNPKGDITYQDGTPRQIWQENRGVITVKASAATSELDAINGDNINDKLKAVIGNSTIFSSGLVEKATTSEILANTVDRNLTADNFRTGAIIPGTLLNGYLQGTTHGRFQYRIVYGIGAIRFVGSISVGGGTNSAPFINMPAGFRPSGTLKKFYTAYSDTGARLTVKFESTGDMSFVENTNSYTSVIFDITVNTEDEA
jgi:hypothetical protein